MNGNEQHARAKQAFIQNDLMLQEIAERDLTDPLPLPEMPRLPDDAADGASASSEAAEAARMLMQLDDAARILVDAHGQDGILALRGTMQAVEAAASSHIENEGLGIGLTDLADALATDALSQERSLTSGQRM